MGGHGRWAVPTRRDQAVGGRAVGGDWAARALAVTAAVIKIASS